MSEVQRVDKSSSPTFIGVLPPLAPDVADTWCDTSAVPYALKVWNGTYWRTLSYYSVRGLQGTAGYIAGGSWSTNASRIDKLWFGGETVAAIATNLGVGVEASHGGQSVQKGYTCGGFVGGPGFRTTIQAFVFSAETNSSLSFGLTTATADGAAVCSGDAMYSVLGYDSVDVNGRSDLNKMSFNVENNQALGKSLTQTAYGRFHVETPIEKGYFLGGKGATAQSGCNRLVFCNETVNSISSGLSLARWSGYSVNTQAVGYLCAGSTGSLQSRVDKLEFTTEVLASVSGALSTESYKGADVNSGLAGYICGGYTTAEISTVRRMYFLDEVFTSLVSGLTVARLGASGFENMS